jgi:hypothetical protein
MNNKQVAQFDFSDLLFRPKGRAVIDGGGTADGFHLRDVDSTNR